MFSIAFLVKLLYIILSERCANRIIYRENDNCSIHEHRLFVKDKVVITKNRSEEMEDIT